MKLDDRMGPSVCLSISLPFCLSVYLSVCLFLCSFLSIFTWESLDSHAERICQQLHSHTQRRLQDIIKFMLKVVSILPLSAQRVHHMHILRRLSVDENLHRH